jgi:tryptophanyl-tRNA synthetase
VHQKEKRCALAFSHHKGTVEVQGAKQKNSSSSSSCSNINLLRSSSQVSIAVSRLIFMSMQKEKGNKEIVNCTNYMLQILPINFNNQNIYKLHASIYAKCNITDW